MADMKHSLVAEPWPRGVLELEEFDRGATDAEVAIPPPQNYGEELTATGAMRYPYRGEEACCFAIRKCARWGRAIWKYMCITLHLLIGLACILFIWAAYVGALQITVAIKL
jgi:hypothetical protein